jgi:DNA-directed RNA polymerase specialized sigma24 family protein
LRYVDNFDPEKSTNPFSYFTQIIYFAFIRRIKKEKREVETKNKILEQSGYSDVFFGDGESSDMNTIKENLYNKMRG